jgi:hypothetical protein
VQRLQVEHETDFEQREGNEVRQVENIGLEEFNDEFERVLAMGIQKWLVRVGAIVGSGLLRESSPLREFVALLVFAGAQNDRGRDVA